MSVKAQSLVWDLPCPHKFNDIGFRPSHKYILVAYADHADHQGKNIWPAVPTIARKTGFEDRSVQRLTRDLEQMGLLVDDGYGPKGTNKWRLPYNQRGDSLSPLTVSQGDSDAIPSGDSASGDSASGDSLSPELNKHEPYLNTLIQKESVFNPITGKLNAHLAWVEVLAMLKTSMQRGSYPNVSDTIAIEYDGETITVLAKDHENMEWLSNRVKATAERALIGILNSDIKIDFVVGQRDSK